MPGFRKKVQEVLLKLFDENETLQKIKAGKPVSNTDLKALTSLVLTQNPSVDQDVLKEFFQTATPLDYAIRSIIGMDADVVNERFVDFIITYPALTSSQISFLNLLKNYISRYGSIEIEQLYEPPFTDPYARWCRRAKVVRPSPIGILDVLFLAFPSEWRCQVPW